MKRTHSLLALGAALLLAAGCRPALKTENFSEVLKQPLVAEGMDTLSIQISLDYPVKGAPAGVLGKMTDQILTAAFDMGLDSLDVEGVAQQYENFLVDQYFDENASFVGKAEKGTLSWEDDINGYFSTKYKKYVVYVIEYYGDHGGAHGINSLTPLVFDRETGELVQEADFFVEGYAERFAPLLQETLKSDFLSLPEDGESSYESLFNKDITPNGCFDVGRHGATWYYQPYEIGPYYLGVISVTLPWSAIKDFVRK